MAPKIHRKVRKPAKSGSNYMWNENGPVMEYKKLFGYFQSNSYSVWAMTGQVSYFGPAIAEVLAFNNQLAIAHYFLDEAYLEAFSFKPAVFLIGGGTHYYWQRLQCTSKADLNDLLWEANISRYYPCLTMLLNSTQRTTHPDDIISVDSRQDCLIVSLSNPETTLRLSGRYKDILSAIEINSPGFPDSFCFNIYSKTIESSSVNFSDLYRAIKEWEGLNSTGYLLEKFCTFVT